jgi:gliding motility-associated-like protein
LKYILSIVILLIINFSISSQIIYLQETLHGGSCLSGVDASYDYGIGNFSIHKPSESTVKKCFLIANNRGNPFSHSISLNGQIFHFDSTSVVANNFEFNTSPANCVDIGLFNTGSINIIDITEFANSQGEDFEIYVSPQFDLYCLDIYYNYFLFVIYEDLSMPLASVVLVLNNQNVSPIWQYNLNGIAPINSNFDVGFTFTNIAFTSQLDGSFLFANGNNMGLCYGDVYSLTGYGNCGSYYYENNELYGLNDDTADDTINGPDALADIQNIVPNGADNLLVEFPFYTEVIDTPYVTTQFWRTNSIWELALAYTPYECELLPVNITSDTAICIGNSVTLTASGGTDYFWQSSMGSLGVLDSTSNSITVAPTTTTSYTVRIEAEGFCPEVRPVQVVVHKIPKPVISSTTSNCGDAVGNIEVTLPYCFCDAFSVNFNNLPAVITDTALSPLNFNNLPTGVYPITITDNIGCAWSGNTFVADTNITIAAFTVEPSSGIEPLAVDLNNNSQHATNYEWSINGEITLIENPTFDTAGLYTIQLIAYNNLPICADTAQFTLFVEPAFEVAVPNIFSPNNDGKNDAFIIDFSRVTSFSISIYNRWGQQVHSLSKDITDLRKESIEIWNGFNVTEGVYYYTLQVTNNYKNYAFRKQPAFKELKGTVIVVR